jgi:hypothetical protein
MTSETSTAPLIPWTILELKHIPLNKNTALELEAFGPNQCSSLPICGTVDLIALEVNGARVLIRECKLLRQCFHASSVQRLRNLANK